MNNLKIGYPCSPSKKISDEVLELVKIRYSFGGGMGGASKTIYAKTMERCTIDDMFYVAILPSGEKIRIGREFIVDFNDVSIVKLVTDTTAHSNYNKTTVNKSILTEMYLLKFGQKYELVNDYISVSSREGNRISSETEIN